MSNTLKCKMSYTLTPSFFILLDGIRMGGPFSVLVLCLCEVRPSFQIQESLRTMSTRDRVPRETEEPCSWIINNT